MGYNLKATYRDLADLEGASGIATVSAIFGKDILEEKKTKEGKFVDLNLVSLSDAREGLTKGFKAPLMEPLSAGSSKRARAPSSGGQTVSCLVDGCKSDLSKCRDYHRRHKVCEMHSKTPKVTIGGHEQRFCQQCSRFHSLGEFDEGKRSCRKRLEGHNRRRRKPQPEPLPVNHANFLSSASQGGRYLAFSNQTMIPASSVVSTTWSGAVKAESNPSPFISSVSASYSQPFRGRQFPFLQATDSPLSRASSPGQVLHHHPTSSSGIGQKMLSNNGLNQVIESDHRALSLLSSSPAETPEMGLGRIIQPNPINHPARPTISSLLYNSMGQFPGMEGQPGGSGSAFLSNMRSSNTNNLCQDVFQSGTDGSSATASGAHHQTLSFSWE